MHILRATAAWSLEPVPGLQVIMHSPFVPAQGLAWCLVFDVGMTARRHEALLLLLRQDVWGALAMAACRPNLAALSHACQVSPKQWQE